MFKKTSETPFKKSRENQLSEEKIDKYQENERIFLVNFFLNFLEINGFFHVFISVMKPLFMASEKLIHYFNPKENSPQKSQFSSEEERVFYSFQASFTREISEEIREKMNKLSINEGEKNENLGNLNEKRRFYDEKNMIHLKKFSKQEEKNLLSDDFLKPTNKYLEKFMDSSKEKWQVARCFVANVIEVYIFYFY